MDFKNVNIFAKGTWNGHKFIEDDLASIVENTNELVERGVLKQPSLKLGHSTNQILKGQSDGDPALGKVINFMVSDGKIHADFIGVPDILAKAIEKGLYKQVSVELRFIESAGWCITNVAVLGADTPAVKTLDDLDNFMTQAQEVAPAGSLELMFSEPLFENLKENMNTEKTNEMEAELADLRKERDLLLAQKKDAAFSDRKTGILAPFKEDVKEGKLQPSILDKIEKHIDEQKLNFSDGADIGLSVELVREIVEVYSDKMPKDEVAEDKKEDGVELSADEAFSEAVNKLVLETGKDYATCTDIVARSNPKLAEAYKQFTEDAREV